MMLQAGLASARIFGENYRLNSPLWLQLGQHLAQAATFHASSLDGWFWGQISPYSFAPHVVFRDRDYGGRQVDLKLQFSTAAVLRPYSDSSALTPMQRQFEFRLPFEFSPNVVQAIHPIGHVVLVHRLNGCQRYIHKIRSNSGISASVSAYFGWRSLNVNVIQGYLNLKLPWPWPRNWSLKTGYLRMPANFRTSASFKPSPSDINASFNAASRACYYHARLKPGGYYITQLLLKRNPALLGVPRRGYSLGAFDGRPMAMAKARRLTRAPQAEKITVFYGKKWL
ncbi:hypothetical protein B0H16DRAFT_1700488 [Mycena metata]|uniref:Uncharacterized protein n=1 Tax=Mycena metata TaxID=1033252 RepID=A0AAD7HEI1_9AGAR|nr:hypothetical protein B0H16DRAFT_1700488 [Mycena metata]